MKTQNNNNAYLLDLSLTAQNLPVSPTLAINEIATQKLKSKPHTLLHMGFGEAMLPLHPLLKQALAESAICTNYGPVRGILELRQEIAEYLARNRNIPCLAEQVIVGPGSKALIYALIRLLDGDVLLPTPSWVSYAPIARLGGKHVASVATDSSDHHAITTESLTKAKKQAEKLGQNPKIMIINSPDNPTGTMFTAENVKEIALWAKKNKITLISDEIYAELAHGWRKHVSPCQFYPEGCIVTGGLSKIFSAGGWRLGYAVLPKTITGEKVINAIRAFGSEVWSTTSTPIQKAAVVAFSHNKEIEQYIEESARVFGHVTQALYTTFKEIGIPCPKPAGGFYLYPDFAPWRSELAKRGIKTSQELAEYLLEEWDIATLPGSAFNEDPKELRLRLSTSILCEPLNDSTPEQREKEMWEILHNSGKKNFNPKLAYLTLAQERWTKFILNLEKSTS